jgi:hypothetical protein
MWWRFTCNTVSVWIFFSFFWVRKITWNYVALQKVSWLAVQPCRCLQPICPHPKGQLKTKTSRLGFCCNKSARTAPPCLVSELFVSNLITWTSENKMSTLLELPIPVQGYILWDVTWFPRGSLKNISPMCHSPLQLGLRQATNNTLMLVCWSTASCLFRHRPAKRTGPLLSATRPHTR